MSQMDEIVPLNIEFSEIVEEHTVVATQHDQDELVEVLEVLDQQSSTQPGDCCQIVDGDGNLITITSEQLIQAGINIAKITDDDVQTLLQLAAEQAANSAESASRAGRRIENDANSSLGNVSLDNNSRLSAAKRKLDAIWNEDRPTLSAMDQRDDCLTESGKKLKVIEDYETEDVDEDVQQLDEETLASLMESGTVKFVDEAGNELPSSSVMAVAQGVSIQNSTVLSSLNDRKLSPITEHVSVSNKYPKSAAAKINSFPEEPSFDRSLLNKEVSVKRKNNKRIPAYIRFIRPGIGYKVQFEDGRFEWVNETDVEISHPNNPTSVLKARGESAGLVASNSDNEEEIINLDSRPRSLLSIRQTSLATGRNSFSLAANRNILKKILNGKGGNEKCDSSTVVKINSSGQLSDCETTSKDGTAFVCPVCEKKVCEKQPSYIVIRLPACSDCAESKILVLDHNSK